MGHKKNKKVVVVRAKIVQKHSLTVKNILRTVFNLKIIKLVMVDFSMHIHCFAVVHMGQYGPYGPQYRVRVNGGGNCIDFNKTL